MANRAVKAYWSILVEDGCCICQRPATIAHCHGGSITERMGPKARGKKLPRMDYLVLPLCPDHAGEGPLGLDGGPLRWESRFGRQADWIDKLGERHYLGLWYLAKLGEKAR